MGIKDWRPETFAKAAKISLNYEQLLELKSGIEALIAESPERLYIEKFGCKPDVKMSQEKFRAKNPIGKSVELTRYTAKITTPDGNSFEFDSTFEARLAYIGAIEIALTSNQ